MSLQLNVLPKVTPVLARHLTAYLDLLADEAAELGSLLAARAIATLIAILTASFAIALGCVWILNTVWDTQWRQVAIIMLFAVFIIATVVAVLIATRRSTAERMPFHRLRSEWHQDQQLIKEFMNAHPELDMTSSATSQSINA